jgi:hypothetical protein
MGLITTCASRRIISKSGVNCLTTSVSRVYPCLAILRGNMSDDCQEMVTQPMLEALLERLQSLETRLEAKMVQTSGATAARFEQLTAGLRTEIASLRTEMNGNFSRLRDEIAILNDDTLKTRAGHRELLRRVEELETKVS